MSGATEEVNVKLIKFGGTDGIEADVMIDTTTYKIKVSQNEIDAAVEKGSYKSETNVPVSVEQQMHGEPPRLLPDDSNNENVLNNTSDTRMQEISSYLNDYKESYNVDLENYKSMKGGSNGTVSTDSNDLSIPLSIALAVLKNQLETASSSNNSTEDKTAKVKELELILGFLERNIEEIKTYLNDPSEESLLRDQVGHAITNTNKSIEGIEDFKKTYKLGEKILSEVVNKTGIKVNN